MNYPIPVAALAQHTALLGKTGSGKTYAAKGVVERLLARGERVAIVDPTGVYWGLRLDAKGKKASPFEIVIFGGRHADLPLSATDGDRLAEIVGTSATPVILDTQLMSVGARTQFFTAFAEGLLRHNRGPLHLVLDEAHLFAPQGGSLGFDTAQMLHATNNLVSLGRSAGLRIMMISQRPAKLHKDSLTQVETLVALRLIAPPDRKAVKDWLDGAPDKSRGDEIMASLASLPQGTGWIYAPEQSVLMKATFPAIQTFDSGRPLESGEAPVLKPIDVASIKAALSVVPHAKPDQLTQAPLRIVGETQAARSGSAVDLAAAEQRGYERGQAEGLRRGAAAGWKAAATILEREITACASLFPPTPDHADAEQEIAAALGVSAWPKAMNKAGSAAARTTKPTAKYDENYAGNYSASPGDAIASAVSTPNSGAPVSMPVLGAERRILAVLAGAHPAGMTEAQWAVAAGMKRTGGTWSTYKLRLRRACAVEARDGQWFSTATGLKSVGSSVERIPPPGPELVEFWIARISGVGPMLRALAGRYPLTFSRMKLAEHLHMAASGGTFGAYLGRLNSAGLIEKIAFNEVRAAPALMESSK